MNVGLPGSGLGTLLYLLLALLMPIRYLARLARGRAAPGEGRLVMRQTVLALGIALMIAATGFGVGMVVLRLRGDAVTGEPLVAIVSRSELAATTAARISAASPVQISVVALTLLLLIAILLAIEVLGALAGRKRRP